MAGRHPRRPLVETQAANIAAGTAPAVKHLNHLENMAIGGRAGLRLRRPAGTAGAGKLISSANSTFALSSDASPVSVRHPEDERCASPPSPAGGRGLGDDGAALRPKPGTAAKDATTTTGDGATATVRINRRSLFSNPQRHFAECVPCLVQKLRKRRPSLDFVTVFDDFSAPAKTVTKMTADAARHTGLTSMAVEGKVTAGPKAEWVVQAAQTLNSAAEADASTDLSEEEEQYYLKQLEQKKEAKAQQKREEIEHRPKVVTYAGVVQPQIVSTLDAGERCESNPNAKDAAGPAKSSPQAKATRKFRVLPAVATVPAVSGASSPLSFNEPRILEVKVVRKPECASAANSPEELQSRQDKSILSPFSEFYYETTGAMKTKDSGCFELNSGANHGSGALDVEVNQHETLDQGDKSVHFASAPLFEGTDLSEANRRGVDAKQIPALSQEAACGQMSSCISALSPASACSQACSSSRSSPRLGEGSAFSRELSLAPKAQRIWPFDEVAAAGQNEESTSTSHEATSLTSAHELVRQSSVSVINALKDIGAHNQDLGKTQSDAVITMEAFLPARSPKANSWSGIGVKIEPIRSSSFRSRDTSLLGGLEVTEMDVGGPAEKSGITVGDVIVHLSNGVLTKGTSAMEATSLLRQQPSPHHLVVSRRQAVWGKQAALLQNGGNRTRKLISIWIYSSSSDVAVGTDLSSGFTLRDGRDDQEEEWSNLPMVADLIDGSSAHKSGLRIGDVLIGVGSLQVSKMPARASISLLLGEAGSQVLLGIYHKPAVKLDCQDDGQPAKPAESVKWLLVERMSGCHVSLEASQTISPKHAEHLVFTGTLLPELSPDLSPNSNRRSPSPTFVGHVRSKEAQESGGTVGALSLSPVPSDVSHETYFAYRDATANSSSAPSPDGGIGHAGNAPAPTNGQAHDAKERCLDESLEELRRQSRAREKRKAFLSKEIVSAGAACRADPDKATSEDESRAGSQYPASWQRDANPTSSDTVADSGAFQDTATTRQADPDG